MDPPWHPVAPPTLPRSRYALCGVGRRLLAPLFLDHVPDFRRDIRAAEPGDGANAGWGGDVDLGEMAVDDVDADKQQSALAQRRAEALTDFALAWRKLSGLGGAA